MSAVSDAMVERVARTIATRELEMGDPPAVIKSIVDIHWKHYADIALSALEAAVQSPPIVGVRALEWDPFRAETPFGYYLIDDQTDRPASMLNGRLPFLLSGSRIDLSRHSTLKAARAAAQADYERRILSSLAPVEVVATEPVALHIVFDGPPRHESGRFVEVETPDGKSVKAGEWHERPDGLWELRIPSHPPGDSEVLREALVQTRNHLDLIITDGIPMDWQAWRDDIEAALSKGEPGK